MEIRKKKGIEITFGDEPKSAVNEPRKPAKPTTSQDIADALFPRARALVLRELAMAGEEPLHIRELARRTGKDPMGVRRELDRLEMAGIVTKSTLGRRSQYRLNANCPVFHELRMLILKTVGAVGQLRDALVSIAKHIQVAFIYGSFATGEIRPESDIDLMVIGEVSFGEVVEAISVAEKQLGREVNPTVYSPKEYSEKIADGHHFLISVLEGEKLFIVGGEDELRKLALGA